MDDIKILDETIKSVNTYGVALSSRMANSAKTMMMLYKYVKSLLNRKNIKLTFKVIFCCMVAKQLLKMLFLVYGRDRLWTKIQSKFETMRSKLLYRYSRPIHQNDHFRPLWQASRHKILVNTPDGHPHPNSASSRTGASRAISEFARMNGYSEYVVSFSQRDVGLDGSHEIMQPKDIHHQPKKDPITENHIIKMIDVDYYLDMPEWIAHGQPIIAYTFHPTEVAYHTDEYDYEISKNEVHMSVAGGTTYKHRLWDYSRDYILTRTGWFDWVVSTVDVRQIDLHHKVVCIVPISRTRFWGWLIPESTLKRKEFFSDGGVVATRYQQDGQDMTSLKLEGRVAHVNLETSNFESAVVRNREAKTPVISDMERFLGRNKDCAEYAHIGGAILFDVLKQHPYLTTHQWKSPRTTAARTEYHYQAVPKGGLITEDGKEIGRLLCQPLVAHPDVIPNRSYNNDLACISGRVISQLNNTTPPMRYLHWVDQFVKELIVNPHAGFPLTADEIIEIQNRPTQRARSNKERPWMVADEAINVRSFMKGESYSKPADPRNISTVGTSHTIQLSRFTHSFKKDILLPQPWYAPGKSPTQIASRVLDVCYGYDKVTEGDFSRFDGTISLWLREQLEQAAYLRWCNRADVDLLRKLLKSEIGVRAWTSQGLAYEPKFSRLSGSPLTTDANTMISAFVAYAAAREAGCSHQESWRLLGVFCGDDMLTPVKGPFVEKSSRCLGMKLKPDIKHRGGDVVVFLGRVFPYAFESEPGSIQDPERTWRKLHISFAISSIPTDQALANKATGLLSLDPEAPIVSTWCKKVLELAKKKGIQGEITEEAPWFVRSLDKDSESWPQCNHQHALEAIAKRTRFEIYQIEEWDTVIQSAKSLSDLANLIPNQPQPVGIEVVMNGEILHPDKDETDSIHTAVVTRHIDKTRPDIGRRRPNNNMYLTRAMNNSRSKVPSREKRTSSEVLRPAGPRRKPEIGQKPKSVKRQQDRKSVV